MSLLLFFAGASIGTTPPTPPAVVVGWIGKLRHTRKELEERLGRQRANTFGRRWFEEYLQAQAAALERAEKAKSVKQREALEEAVEAAAEAMDAAIEQGREVYDITVALNAAASASRLTASIKHARAVIGLAKAYDEDEDEEAIELLLLH